jgi:hypothetical protein
MPDNSSNMNNMIGADGNKYNSMKFLLRNDFLTSCPAIGTLTVQLVINRLAPRVQYEQTGP